jgi:hypothetical protein
LPVEQRVNLPDGIRVLLVHSSPGRDDGPSLTPEQSDDALAQAGFGKRQWHPASRWLARKMTQRR